MKYEWKIHSKLFKMLDRKWGRHTIDRFASLLNHKTPLYNSRFKDPRSYGIDALAQDDWGIHNNWVNAPFRLLDQVVEVISRQQAVATVIAPAWRGQNWYQKLIAMSVDRPFRLPRNSLILQNPVTGTPEPLKNPKWRLYAWRIYGGKN